MSKYPCELIEDLIPLYIEDDVNETTKEIIEEHFQECERCSLLAKKYSDDEINQIYVEEINNDLPQADTFKKWVKRLKVWGMIASLLMVTALITIGAVGYFIGEKSENNLLTLKKVVKTFQSEGLNLRKDKEKSPDDYSLNGVKPAIYTIGDSNDTLLIYVFNSFREKEEITNNIDKYKRYNINTSLEEKVFHVKNALIIYRLADIPETKEELTGIAQTIDLISDIVFEKLNDGKTIVYKGESESWEGTYTLKYYEHFYKENGQLDYDSYHEGTPELQYKKSDIESVGPIMFEYKAGSSSGYGYGQTLDDKGHVQFGKRASNGAFLREDEIIVFTVKWGNREEQFELKAQ